MVKVLRGTETLEKEVTLGRRRVAAQRNGFIPSVPLGRYARRAISTTACVIWPR